MEIDKKELEGKKKKKMLIIANLLFIALVFAILSFNLPKQLSIISIIVCIITSVLGALMREKICR